MGIWFIFITVIGLLSFWICYISQVWALRWTQFEKRSNSRISIAKLTFWYFVKHNFRNSPKKRHICVFILFDNSDLRGWFNCLFCCSGHHQKLLPNRQPTSKKSQSFWKKPFFLLQNIKMSILWSKFLSSKFKFNILFKLSSSQSLPCLPLKDKVESNLINCCIITDPW